MTTNAQLDLVPDAPAERSPEPASVDRPTPRDAHEEQYELVIHAFREIALAACSDSITLDNLLRLVGRQLCKLLGVDRCSVYLRRKDGRFQGQVGYCAKPVSIDAKIRRLITGVDSFTAEIVRSTAPVLIHDAPKDPRTVQRTMRRWRVMDMLGVPLVIEGEVIGIIYVDDQARPHEFSAQDVRLAEAFASLSAFAVKQTWQWERLLRQAKATDQERRSLARANELQQAAADAIAEGADLARLLQLAAEELRKPVVVYGPGLELVAQATPEDAPAFYAPTLDPSMIEQPFMTRILAKLEHGGEPALIRPSPELKCRRLLARIAARDETLGFLEIHELGTAFDPTDHRVVEALSTAVGLRLRLSQHVGPQEVVGRLDYMVDLLFGRREKAVLEARSASFGVDPRRAHVVMVLPPERGDTAGTPGETAPDVFATRLAESTGQVLRLVEQVVAGEHHLVLFEARGDESSRVELKSHLERAARECTNDMATTGQPVFTDFCTTLGDLPNAVRQAIGVADLLDKQPAREMPFAFAHELEMIRLVAQGSMREATRAAAQILNPLREHDASTSGNLVETLRVFIENGAQYRSTAAALGVHENTVRYRLNRIGEISSVDPNNFQDLTRAQFAYQVMRLLPSAEPNGIGPEAASFGDTHSTTA